MMSKFSVTETPRDVSVANVGSEAVSVTVAPGTPDAVTGTDRVDPPATVTSAIGVIASVGALATLICVTAAPERAFAAVNRTSYSPASTVVVDQLNTPSVFELFGVNVAPAGRPE